MGFIAHAFGFGENGVEVEDMTDEEYIKEYAQWLHKGEPTEAERDILER